MRENRPYGSEGGVGASRSRPLSYAAARRCGRAAITETFVIMGPRLRGDDSGWVRAKNTRARWYCSFPLARGDYVLGKPESVVAL